MQDFDPTPDTYDVIWVQWVIGHLTDNDLVAFLRRCKPALVKGGCFCIKDNVSYTEPVFDSTDSSVTRSHDEFLALFEQAGMDLLLTQPQKGFPSSLFTVNMYCL